MMPDSFRNPTLKARHFFLLAIVVGLTLIAVLIPPFDQPSDYHQWVDTRTLLGIPHFGDVLSNLGFIIVGLLGLKAIIQRRLCCRWPEERVAWNLVFIGVLLTGFGSSYYHWQPNDFGLMWDRLPMALGFMALLSALITERLSPRLGLRLLPLLVLFGCASVIYWYWSSLQGAGDLRPYLLTQGGTLLLIPIILWLYPPAYTRGQGYLIALGLYLLALVAEHLDEAIFTLTHFVSGHNLKHLLAALAVYWLLHMLRMRAPLTSRAGP